MSLINDRAKGACLCMGNAHPGRVQVSVKSKHYSSIFKGINWLFEEFVKL